MHFLQVSDGVSEFVDGDSLEHSDGVVAAETA